jgi:LPS-assembly protein
MRVRLLLASTATLALLCSLASAQPPAGAGPAPPRAQSAPAGEVPAAVASEGRKGDDQVLLQADQIIYDGDAETVAAVGHVEIVDQGRILNADKVTYDQKTDTVTASGNVSLTDASGNVAFANDVVLTKGMRDGALNGFGALIGKNGRLAAADAQRINGNTLIANHIVYSPCQICNQPGQRTPLWRVKSERVVYDQTKHRIHFKNATLEFFDVPVFYSPVLSEPDPSVKYASGLLAPDVGNSTKIGYFARVPVYIALNDNNDATIAGMYSTEGGEMLEGEYRARWNNSGLWLQGSAAYNPRGGLGGGTGPQDLDHLFGSGRFVLSDVWRAGFDVQLTNNPAYMRFYDISTLDRLVNDLFAEADSGRSRFAASGYYFQGLRSTDIARRIPFVLPRLTFNFIPTKDVLGGQFRFDADAVALTRGSGRDDQRLTAEAVWKKPMILPGGQLWTFILDGRGDEYHVATPATATTPSSDNFIGRGTGYAELDWRWPFVAPAGTTGTYLLEPVAQFIAQPYGGNPAGLRNEDGNDFEFDENDIFSVSQIPGYDLIESGPRANLGLRAAAIFPGGEAEAVVGQTYRFKPDPIFAAGSGETGNSSDIVGRASIKFAHLDFADRIDLDRGNGTLKRHEMYVTGTYNRSSLQISYVQLPPEAVTLGLGSRQEANIQGDFNFYKNWQAFAAIRRDLEAGKMLDTEFGLGYEDECLAISVAYRRRYTFDALLGLPPSTSVILRFSLKTGDQPVQPFSLFPQDVFTSTHP